MKKLMLCIMVLAAMASISIAAQLDSSAFPYKYEAGVLPSADTPAYSYTSNNETAEGDYASVAGGILTLDTGTDGADSDSAWYSLTGGVGTVWDPHFLGGYTMEVRMKSKPNNAGAYNTWFEWTDVNSVVLLQVWHNKVSLNGVEVTGLDNQTNFHDYRIVANVYTSSADQRFDLYRDGVVIIDEAPDTIRYNTWTVKFGDMTGFAESNVDVDYIRWDDSNAWEPVPEPATMALFGLGGLALLKRKK